MISDKVCEQARLFAFEHLQAEDVARVLWGGEEKGLYYSLPPIILGQGSIVISSVRLLALPSQRLLPGSAAALLQRERLLLHLHA